MRIKILSTILISIPLLTACDIGRELAQPALMSLKIPKQK